VRRLGYEPIANTMAWNRTGRRFATPALRDAALPAATDYKTHFDGPSVYELIDRRNTSIASSQALFLMNHRAAARGIAAGLVSRLRIDSEAGLLDTLDALYMCVYQRPPSDAERIFAKGFVARRRQQIGAAHAADETRAFAALLLCSNEALYVE